MTEQQSSDPRQRALEQRAENEVMFQKANDGLAKLATQVADDMDDFHKDIAFFCECSNARCILKVHTSLDEFDEISRRKNQFIIAAGHDDQAIEDVVDRRPGFWVVQKIDSLV